MNQTDGANYAPKGKPQLVCAPGDFIFAAVGLDHGHIRGMCNGLIEAGGTLKYVHDQDPAKVEAFHRAYPQATAVSGLEAILDDASVRLVASAAVPSDRCDLGLRVMESGRDFFADKPPFTTLAQLAAARDKAAVTGRKYMVYFGERLHVECAVLAGQLIAEGAIGRVLQVTGIGPHRLNAPSRPGWFFDKAKYGGILCDIGVHQIEQYLSFSGASDAAVAQSQVANYNHPEHPGLEDFGQALLLGENGTTGFFRVDWFTPDGLSVWGDGRTVIMGTGGYIELRKYVDITQGTGRDHLYLVDGQGERLIEAAGTVGYPFFGQLILDCLNRTEYAMTQAHAFKAAEIALKAQEMAVRVE